MTVFQNDRSRYIRVDAIVLDESEADACISALELEERVLISAGTLAEVLIVATRRNVATELAGLIEDLGIEIVSVAPASARRIADAYRRWGKRCKPGRTQFRRLLRLRGRENPQLPASLRGSRFCKDRHLQRLLTIESRLLEERCE